MKLTGKSLRSDFARFVSATTASLMVFCLYSVVDGLMVARGVGEYAMSAVNLALPFTNLLFAVAVMFAVGSSTIIAIFMAQKKKREADELLIPKPDGAYNNGRSHNGGGAYIHGAHRTPARRKRRYA